MADEDGSNLGWYSSRQRTLIPLDQRFPLPQVAAAGVEPEPLSSCHQPGVWGSGSRLRRPGYYLDFRRT